MLKAEGNETVTNCHGLKMLAPDGKMRMTDVADTGYYPLYLVEVSRPCWRYRQQVFLIVHWPRLSLIYRVIFNQLY
jgi:hypothetical protein